MKRQSGFTLIEILVVLFIVAIMSGIVVAHLPRMARSGNLDTEARRLKELLAMAKQNALLEANEYGFKPEHTGYEFYVYDDLAQKWTPLTKRPFQKRQLPDGLVIEATVEDSQLKLKSENKHSAPPILILSSGETTPFHLTISMPSAGRSRTLVADGYGEFKWQGNASQNN